MIRKSQDEYVEVHGTRNSMENRMNRTSSKSSAGGRKTPIGGRPREGSMARKTPIRGMTPFRVPELEDARKNSLGNGAGCVKTARKNAEKLKMAKMNRRIAMKKKFIRIVRRIILMYKVARSIRVYAMSTGNHHGQHKDAAQADVDQPYSIQTKHDRPRLYFNPKYFETVRATMMSAKTRNICRKGPLERTDSEIASLRAVLRGITSFSMLSVELQKALCRVMRYERFERRRIVIKKGHVGMSMYFLCYGSVGVVHDRDASTIFSQTDPIILRRGASFGELALMSKCTRNATICCIELCEFMVIDKEDFHELGLVEIVKREYRQRHVFFQNHALAHGYTTSTKNVLADESKSELVEIDRTVCHDTAASKYTYFVMKGIVDIYRFVRLNACPTFANLLNEKLPNVKSRNIGVNDDYEVCALVGTLRSGSCFTPQERLGRSFTLVSKGATIIRFEVERLKTLQVFDVLVKSSAMIPTDDEICEQFMIKNKWNFWKKCTLQDDLYYNGSVKCKRLKARPKTPKHGLVRMASKNKSKSRIVESINYFQNKPTLIHAIHLPIFTSASFKQW